MDSLEMVFGDLANAYARSMGENAYSQDTTAWSEELVVCIEIS